MLLIVRARLSRDEELLLQELLSCGRLSSEQLLQRAVEAYASAKGLPLDSAEVGDKRLALHAAASALEAARFISHSEVLPASLVIEDTAPPETDATPPLPAPASGSSGGRKRKSSGGKGAADGASARQVRHSVSPSTLGHGAQTFSPLLGVVNGRVAGDAARSSVLWRANFGRFACAFRHQAIMKVVGEKIDGTAQSIVETALDLLSNQPTSDLLSPYENDGAKPAATAPFTVDNVLAKCPVPLDWQLVCNYLDTMCNEPLCKMASTLNGKYILELGELGNAVKQLLLEAVVRERVGELGVRLYRSLLRKHAHGGCSARGQQKHELKQLAEDSLMPERDARPLMMKLLLSGYALLQEVPRTLDRNPKATTHLWHVSLPGAYRALELEMLGSLLNLHRRLEHEKRGLVDPPAAPPASLHGEHITEAQRHEAVLASRRVETLQNSIAHLHETFMTLRTV